MSDLAARNFYDQGRYPITTPTGRVIDGPPAGSFWRVSRTKFDELDRDGRVWWGKTGNNRPGIKRFLTEVKDGVVPQKLWLWQEVGSTRHSKQELSAILAAKAGTDLFVKPKPVSLLDRILQIGCDAKGIVLDIFAGSGTTGHAVLKANAADVGSRRFVMVSNSEATAEEPDKRNVRRDSEQNDSIDSMIGKLRKLGHRIGVVVDEAHHSFHGETQAAKFFREVFAPEYGYVFLADPTAQTGIDLAGQRINRIQTEYAKVSQKTTVVNVGGRSMVQAVAVGGQFSLFPQSTSGWPMNDVAQPPEEDGKPDHYDASDFDLGGFFGNPSNETGGSVAGGGKGSRPAAARRFSYPLRDDAPRFFQTQTLSPDVSATEEDCAQRFLISTRALFEAIRSRVKVERKTLDVFTGQMQFDLMGAELEPSEIDRRALRALQHSPGVFDPRELRQALLRKVEAVLREEFLDEANDPLAVRRMLDTLLALHPESLGDKLRIADFAGWGL